jgi:hypothetical protein
MVKRKPAEITMAIEASSATELAAIMSFGALAAKFILDNPGMLDQFDAWNREHGSSGQIPHARSLLDHLSQHLLDIAETAVSVSMHQN